MRFSELQSAGPPPHASGIRGGDKKRVSAAIHIERGRGEREKSDREQGGTYALGWEWEWVFADMRGWPCPFLSRRSATLLCA